MQCRFIVFLEVDKRVNKSVKGVKGDRLLLWEG